MKHRGLIWIVGLAALGVLAPEPAAAQGRVGRYIIGPDGEPDMPATMRARQSSRSAFALFANRDFARSNLRGVGTFKNTCLDNFSGLWNYGCAEFYIGPGNSIFPNGYESQWFSDGHYAFGVPAGEWNRHKVTVPSLANALGGGYTANTQSEGPGNDDVGSLDNTLGPYHAGVQSVSDGSCFDHRNSFGAGNPLLAGFGCPQTYGSLGWVGARAVPLEVWQAHFQAEGPTFNWNFWRIPDSELDAAGIPREKPIGAFQTYGFFTDSYEEALFGASNVLGYGRVVPGGQGAPERTGWPLGLEGRTDAFSFQIPALKDVVFYQTTIWNNSQRVYGVGLDYDSLYISLVHSFYHQATQQASVYEVIPWGALVSVEGTVNPCSSSRDITDIGCFSRFPAGTTQGFERGSAALIMLKSPIGDLLNKHFSRPASPFYSPGHPLAGDTITFNHHHMCGFRACARNTAATDPSLPDHEQRTFGMMSSTENNVLGSRTATSLTDQVFWHTFRPYTFPSRTPPFFNRYVPPGNWDYNHDGVPDTLFYDNCHQTAGCAALFGDTTPSGKYNGYTNVFAQMAVGPIRLAAGDTVSFVIAATSAVDSASLLAQIQAAIDAYMNFYLGPEAAPKTRVVATEVAAAAEGSSISLFWDESAERYTDPFLKKQYDDLVAAGAGSPLGRLRDLNPRLDDTLSFLYQNNLARLHVFKSCDGGGSWTDDQDCEGDRALGGTFRDVGWQPYRTYAADDPGGIPNSFTDTEVAPGQTYLYNFIGETRGASLIVQNGDSTGVVGGETVCLKACRVEVLQLAPVIINALSQSTSDQHVARVYVTASRQAGALPSRASIVDSVGPMAGRRVTVGVAADSVAAADYRVRFSANGYAVKVTYRTGSTVDSVRTTVALLDGATPVATLTGRNIGGFTASGGTTITTTAGGVTRDSTAFSTTVLALSRLRASSEEPLLVSGTLTGAGTTAGAFYGNPDFPGFTVAVNASLTGNFEGYHYRTQAGGGVIGPLVEPTVVWLPTLSSRFAASTAVAAGDYAITWVDRAFGPGEPFDLDLVNRTQTAQTVATSITSRRDGSVGDTTSATATKIGAALVRPGLTGDSLVPVKVPFTVRNLSYGRDVTVAMLRRSNNSVVVGAFSDTVRVPIAGDDWVPGDRLFFLEPDASGALQVTFTAATIGCDASRFTRLSCNPVRVRPPSGTGSAANTATTVYLGPEPPNQLRVSYYTPVTSASQFTIRTVGPLRGEALFASPDLIRAGLAAVRVVPNPYIMISQFDNNLMFTHVPPRGLIRLYTVSGQFVQQISWDESDLSSSGDLRFNLRTREGNLIGAGLYIYVLHARDASDQTIGTRTGKFVVIR